MKKTKKQSFEMVKKQQKNLSVDAKKVVKGGSSDDGGGFILIDIIDDL